MNEALVYVWTNTENNKFYIGKHRGSEDDGYISSGKYFLIEYNISPHIFVRDIVFRGTNSECLLEETRRIQKAVQTVGWERIYNLTTWNHLKRWTRKCLCCGAVCCPENKQWADAFEQVHFENCIERKSKDIRPRDKKPPKKGVMTPGKKKLNISNESVASIMDRIYARKYKLQ